MLLCTLDYVDYMRLNPDFENYVRPIVLNKSASLSQFPCLYRL